MIKKAIILTKVPGEKYQSYILRVSKDSETRKVKLADILDNLGTLECFLPKEQKRKIEKYKNAIDLLFMNNDHDIV